ncbi:MAG: hypothetical protein AB8G77_12275 [Rhodothermales bacterium]
MHLLLCKSCSTLVPNNEHQICPHCYGDLRRKKWRGVDKFAVALFWGFNALVLLLHIGYWAATNSIQENDAKATFAGKMLSTNMMENGEIMIYWLAGSFVLGILVLMTRD